MIKANNKNTRTTSLKLFTSFSSVSVVDFKQVNVSRGTTLLLYYFYILFTAYLLHEEVMSVRLYVFTALSFLRLTQGLLII